ncbi:MAG: DegT/DnrJ/EryC1/StrS family aminotransferase [Lentisphaerae bacterium]|nr:MAG: DegT/DnrJ/EryC1/StrS family aminotransferase [Lentisphaerota bacterium]
MILFNDFKAHLSPIRSEIEAAIRRVLDSGWYILGQEVDAFEKEFAAFLNVPHCIGVGNGTEAIALALMALGIEPGQEVITTAMTAYPTITAITMTGAIPVVVDIDPETGLLDPSQLSKALSPRTRIILPVHLYGNACDMDAILHFAHTHGLHVIEDCAQATGTRWRNRACGTFGKIGCFSFYPTKNLGACGDGGAVVTSDPELAEKLRYLRNYGQTSRYHHDFEGINSRLDEIQAAILRVKLHHLPTWNAKRNTIANVYRQSLKDASPKLKLPVQRPEVTHTHHLFPVLLSQRDQICEKLREEGVQTISHYPVAVHQQKAFHGRTQSGGCPRAEEWAHNVLSLPCYPELPSDQLQKICNRLLHLVNLN